MGYPALTDEQLLLTAAHVPDEHSRDALLRATPLWYYCLCEAMVSGENGAHLGDVGGRIVAEVLVGLLEGDPQSYVRQWPSWKPDLPARDPDSFDMADLVRFATETEVVPTEPRP
jgi:hypothetical protein